MWKFQPPSWKDSPTRYATPRKIHKVELRIYLKDGVDVDQAYAALGQRYCGEFFTVPPLHRSGWFVCVLQTDENGAALQCTVGRGNTR